ncbi:alpha/beta fold hydrolase [Aquibacillus kalidii]|uniref:alpha/beta fold hydrolase n=1 Tax=Aquibacillus kalidii TaxID=2762597 RepID=UPI001648365A|nr:alpha/beta hydrolase [Aquibacillus kalidii]
MSNNNAQNKYISYKGSKICYQLHQTGDHSSKEYLIFVHGFLSSQYSFRKMIPLLIDNYNIITLDLPPFGDSDRINTFLYSYKNMADLIIHFMNEHNIKQAQLVGHSMGGQIALTCAYHYPDRIKKLILLAPSSYMKKSDKLSYFVSSLPFFTTFIRKLMKRKGVYHTIRQSLYNDDMITEEMLNQYKKPFSDKKIYACLAKMVRDREGDLKEDHLHEIKTECSIFWGKKDEILPVRIAYQLIRDLSNAELCTFRNAGHLLPEEVPHVICDCIKAGDVLNHSHLD